VIPALHLEVPQGVGDAYWAVQVFARHAARLDLTVLCVGDDPIQRRAEPFLKLLGAVGSVRYRRVEPAEYDRVAATRWDAGAILARARAGERGPFPYACNRPLEQGVRLEDLAGRLAVEWEPAVRWEDPAPPARDYAVAYVSGSRPAYAWPPARWADLVAGIWSRHRLAWPIVLLGADYDRAALEDVRAGLALRGLDATLRAGGPAAVATGLIRGARLFVGYQSGLNVLADRFDVPQLMVYFPHLRRMLYSWCKPGHRESGTFQAATFDEGPHAVLDSFRLRAGPQTPAGLEWCPARGIARDRSGARVEYDEAYFRKYETYQDSPIGRRLNAFRVGFAARHAGRSATVLDFGIGCGTFLRRWEAAGGRGLGYDINPAGVDWLRARGIYHDPWEGLPDGCAAVTLFDSLEHLEGPGELLGRFPAGTTVLASLPIIPDLRHLRQSKHFRPGEHYFYATDEGFRGYMADLGYRLLEATDAETRAGREQIMSYALRKE
jgi:hypothetical protein